MVNNKDFQRAVELINKAENVLLTTHARPDGDACGCIAAMYDVLTGIGKKAKAVLLSEIPEWYEFLFAQAPSILGKDKQKYSIMLRHKGIFRKAIILYHSISAALSLTSSGIDRAASPITSRLRITACWVFPSASKAL